MCHLSLIATEEQPCIMKLVTLQNMRWCVYSVLDLACIVESDMTQGRARVSNDSNEIHWFAVTATGNLKVACHAKYHHLTLPTAVSVLGLFLMIFLMGPPGCQCWG